MVSNAREWSVPAPVRALLWWPAISFVLVVVAPETAIGTIVASGALLAVIGGLISTSAQRLRELRAEAAAVTRVTGTAGGAVSDAATVFIEGPAARQAAAQHHAAQQTAAQQTAAQQTAAQQTAAQQTAAQQTAAQQTAARRTGGDQDATRTSAPNPASDVDPAADPTRTRGATIADPVDPPTEVIEVVRIGAGGHAA